MRVQRLILTQRFGLRTILLLFLLLVPGPLAFAQIDSERLKLEQEQLERNQDLSEARKEELAARIENQLDRLKEIRDLREQAQDFTRQLEQLPEKTRQLQAETKRLERGAQAVSEIDLEDTGLEVIEQRVLKTENRLKKYASEAESLRSRLQAEQQRPSQIRIELESLEVNTVESVTVPEDPAESVGLPELLDIWAEEIDERLTEARREALETELLSHPARVDWLRAQIENRLTLVQRTRTELRIAETALAALRTQDAESIREQAVEIQQQLGNRNPAISAFAQGNIRLSNELADTARQNAELTQVVADVNQRMQKLSENFERTRQKIEVAGLSQALGQVLLEERRRLSALATVAGSQSTERERIAELGLRQIQHEEERQDLRDLDAFVNDWMLRQEDPGLLGARGEIRELAERRSVLLQRLIDAEQTLLLNLSDLDFARRQLQNRIDAFRDFITERLLWIRSAGSLSLDLLLDVPRQVLELLDPSHGFRFLRDFRDVISDNALGVFVLMVGLVLFVRERRHLRVALRNSAIELSRLSTDNYLATLRALLITVALALPFPVVLIAIGSLLEASEGLGKSADAFAPALVLAGRYLFFVQLLRQLGKPDGVFRNHFKWTESTVTAINIAAWKLLWFFLPAMTLTYLVINYDFGALTGALTHLSLAVSMGILAYCLAPWWQPRPRRGESSSAWVKAGTFRLLRWTLVGVPAALAIVGLMGYHYTAGTLIARLLDTFGLGLILLLLHQLVLRWLTLTQRKHALQEARERRAAMRQKAEEKLKQEEEGEALAETGSLEAQMEVEEPRIDIEAVSKGARELLNTFMVLIGAAGVWYIWSEVLPAFGILQEFALWSYEENTGGNAVAVPVTLFDLFIAILVVTLTVLAAKRFPALLEFILLQRLNMSAGGLYTVRTLSGYVIVAFGMITAFNTLGASWSQIQWLAAALSVGIGFGLQEIVANFISGLIILFERPIRVGDVVTVGDTDGVVTRINIRATTIRNWEQKELLVPNKEFITSRLLNWTLSDHTTRLFLPVGVAYGCEVEKATEIIQEIVSNHPQILEDPAPSVHFEGLGDNALLLNVRCFVNNLELRLVTTSELYTRIYNALNAAGIGIAFPQRDVHLDTLRPLEVQIVDRPAAAPTSAVPTSAVPTSAAP